MSETPGVHFGDNEGYKGLRRVLTYGTFDLLHYGHIRLLRRLRLQSQTFQYRRSCEFPFFLQFEVVFDGKIVAHSIGAAVGNYHRFALAADLETAVFKEIR